MRLLVADWARKLEGVEVEVEVGLEGSAPASLRTCPSEQDSLGCSTLIPAQQCDPLQELADSPMEGRPKASELK